MKIKHLLVLVLLILILPLNLLGSEPVKHHIIVDTDCAPDDLRALNLLFSLKNTEILAITSSDGVIEPEEGYLKINSFLNYLGHEGIPISQGIINKSESPAWRKTAKSVSWGNEIISYREPMEVKEFLINHIEKENNPVELVCLGPLTNIANAVLMKPEIKEKIKRIIWFDQCQMESEWTNYKMDPLSADYLLKTKIPIYRIMAGNKPVSFSEEFYTKLGKINTPYANLIYRSHRSDTIKKKIKNEHLKIWDELAALYLAYPDQFERDTSKHDSLGQVMKIKKQGNVKKMYIELLKEPINNEHVTLRKFPTDTAFYKEDINTIADSTIRLYGIREWKAIILTNEIHNHLGLYSIIGAKMGIRSLEYFHARGSHLEITSDAGILPPLSCMNDGLQTATGSTLGNGLYTIDKKGSSPRAIIKHDNQKIEIQLKTKYYNEVQQTIISTKNQFGPDSQKYWDTIRKKGIEIWKKWDRRKIFDITRINR